MTLSLVAGRRWQDKCPSTGLASDSGPIGAVYTELPLLCDDCTAVRLGRALGGGDVHSGGGG